MNICIYEYMYISQGDEAIALMSRERDAMRSQVRYLEERAREFARSVAVVQEDMARVVEGTAQTLGLALQHTHCNTHCNALQHMPRKFEV